MALDLPLSPIGGWSVVAPFVSILSASTLSTSVTTSLSGATVEGLPRDEDPSEATPAAGDRCEDARVIGLLVDSIPILLIAASAACRLALTSSPASAADRLVPKSTVIEGVGALEGSIFGSTSVISTVGSAVEAALSAVLPDGTLLVPVEVKISGGRDDHGVTNPFPSTAVLGDQFARGGIPLWAILAKFGGGRLTAEDEWCSVGSRPCA